jgi:uncharacterized protein YceH (UPF0502 family)
VDTAAVIAAAAAILGPLVAYVVAARRFSGKIETTEASELWAESRSIRDWSQKRIQELEARIRTLEADGAELRRRLDAANRRLEVFEAAV